MNRRKSLMHMSRLDEVNLRWLAAAIGLTADEKEWNEQQVERWIFVVHEYEDKLSVERLTRQLGRLRTHHASKDGQ